MPHSFLEALMKLHDIDISTLVPHDKPMLLLDSAIEADEMTMTAMLNITENSMFCRNGTVGAWVGLEYMAQTVAAHAGFLANNAGLPVKLGYLLGTRYYHCNVSGFHVGESLKIRVKRQYELIEEELGSYECSILSNGNQIANAVCIVYQPPKS